MSFLSFYKYCNYDTRITYRRNLLTKNAHVEECVASTLLAGNGYLKRRATGPIQVLHTFRHVLKPEVARRSRKLKLDIAEANTYSKIRQFNL